MARRAMEMALVMVLVTILSGGAMAQSGCTTAIIGLSPCLGFITGNTSKPSSSCCTQLASVVQNQPQCLCTVLNGGGSSFGININQTQALALPGACNVKTPPVSQCNAAGGPSTSPPAADGPSADTPSTQDTPSTPADASPATPSVPTIPSGTGSRTVPSPNGVPSSASSATFSRSLFFFLCVASYASTLAGF